MAASQGIKLDDDTRERLRALAEVRQRSPHWIMKTAIQLYLDREEAVEQEKREDMARWEAFQLTGNAIPHVAAAAWLQRLADGEDAACPT